MTKRGFRLTVEGVDDKRRGQSNRMREYYR